jgi:hypothetical protein
MYEPSGIDKGQNPVEVFKFELRVLRDIGRVAEV